MDKDDLKEEKVLKTLMELLSTPSPTGGERPLLLMIRGRLEGRGFQCEEEEVKGAQRNLIAVRGKPRFLLATHLDTVPPWGHPHATTPLAKDGEVWGRGAVDAKGQIAALLMAVEDTEAPCSIALFCDEEGEGRGSRAFRPPPGLKGALVLEPTGLKLAVAEAGSVEVMVRMKGKAAHGTMPSSGKNAIEELMEAYGELKSLPFLSLNHPLFPPFRPNIGYIRGGRDPQLVPDSCEAWIDTPVPPGVDVEEARELIVGVFERRGAEVRIKDLEPPWEMGEGDREVMELIAEAYRRALGIPPELWGMPSWTDAANLRQKGIMTLVLGAGDLALAHTPEERISIAEVYKLAVILKELLELLQVYP